MTKKETNSGRVSDLRKQAEKINRGKASQSPENIDKMSPAQIKRTLHELRVHQIELDVQNDELRRMQVELETARSKYFDLYDLAPVGYCTLSEKGLILEANLTAATFLGEARSKLVNKLFFRFILKEDQHIYFLQLNKIFETGKPQACELRMVKKDAPEVWARLEVIAARDVDGAPTCRIVMSNITERKQAEEALRESELKYRSLVECSSDAIFCVDEKGKYQFTNHLFSATFGKSPDYFIGKTFWDIYPKEHADQRYEVTKRVFSTSRSESVEVEVPLPDKTLYFYATANPIKDETGKVILVLTHAADITDRKRAEVALLESDEKHKRMVANISDVIAVMDKDGTLKYKSPNIEKYFGWQPKDLVGTDGWLTVHPDDLVRIQKEFFTLLEKDNSVASVEYKYKCKDGSYKLIALTAVNLTNDPIISGVLMNYRDITERKQAESALRDSEERFNTLSNATWEGIIIHKEGIILDANESALKMYGYPAEEVIGKNIIDFVAPESTAHALQKLREGATNDQLYLELNILRKDKTILPAEALGRPIRYKNLDARVTAIRDITERKQAEAEKEKLEAQNRQLQKSESLGRMAASIAHHFNNQLGVVIGNLEMAIDEQPKGAPPARSLTAAMEAAWKSADMSGLMLTYLGQTHEEVEPLDLSYSCRKILPLIEVILPGNVVMETDFPLPRPIIIANTGEIQQILTNLITNAQEAIGNNSGTVSLSVKIVSPAEISTRNRFPVDWQPQDKAYARMEVTDTGSGIDDKAIEQLFDPFFTDKFTGRGMGLPVVLGLVKAHKGVITVNSKPARGSTFRAFFPLSTETLPQPQTVENDSDITVSAPSPGKMEEGGTVLLVEDEEPLRKMAAIMLERLGFIVLEAKDGIEALEVFGQHQSEIKLVISDLTMPRMNGWETLTELRKLQPDIPVILASGYDKAHVMSGDHPELPQAFLPKPYNRTDLSDAIRQVMEKAEGKRKEE